MKLTHEIKFKVDGEEYNIIVKDLKKSERKQIESEFYELKELEKKLLKVVSRAKILQDELKTETEVKKKIEIKKEISELQKDLEQYEDMDIESKVDDLYKARMELSIDGQDASKILQLAEEYGYKRFFEAILKSVEIQEKK